MEMEMENCSDDAEMQLEKGKMFVESLGDIVNQMLAREQGWVSLLLSERHHVLNTIQECADRSWVFFDSSSDEQNLTISNQFFVMQVTMHNKEILMAKPSLNFEYGGSSITVPREALEEIETSLHRRVGVVFVGYLNFHCVLARVVDPNCFATKGGFTKDNELQRPSWATYTVNTELGNRTTKQVNSLVLGVTIGSYNATYSFSRKASPFTHFLHLNPAP
ncbi:unnamed protein product [Darwinula stevensoni]|uniref:Uncharacterized protein n=1 Tax=Darwinula stevensoni TaxID=69355 RepID=A0A7R9AFD7_9CRUS|nr:unnamed protein product [Darwinula stevensoni]CAG0902881.1 unnamed protein product [Darwinula stevensoni]